MNRLAATSFASVLMAGCVADPATEQVDINTQAETNEECEPVSDELMAKIAEFQQEGVGMEPVRAVAYRSPDHEEVWLVAMEFAATGIDNQTGVWATNSLDPASGVVMSVDGTAQQFSVTAAAETTDAAIGPADPVVETARSCL